MHLPAESCLDVLENEHPELMEDLSPLALGLLALAPSEGLSWEDPDGNRQLAEALDLASPGSLLASGKHASAGLTSQGPWWTENTDRPNPPTEHPDHAPFRADQARSVWPQAQAPHGLALLAMARTPGLQASSDPPAEAAARLIRATDELSRERDKQMPIRWMRLLEAGTRVSPSRARDAARVLGAPAALAAWERCGCPAPGLVGREPLEEVVELHQKIEKLILKRYREIMTILAETLLGHGQMMDQRTMAGHLAMSAGLHRWTGLHHEIEGISQQQPGPLETQVDTERAEELCRLAAANPRKGVEVQQARALATPEKDGHIILMRGPSGEHAIGWWPA